MLEPFLIETSRKMKKPGGRMVRNISIFFQVQFTICSEHLDHFLQSFFICGAGIASFTLKSHISEIQSTKETFIGVFEV